MLLALVEKFSDGRTSLYISWPSPHLSTHGHKNGCCTSASVGMVGVAEGAFH